MTACERVANGTESARSVAKKFHLLRFKSYIEPYEIIDAQNPTKKPAFRASSVTGVSVPVREEDVKMARQELRRLTVDIGQAVVRFDLSIALEDTQRLNGQIESVKKGLKKQLERLRTEVMTTGIDSRNRSIAAIRIKWLKALDLQQLECTNTQRADELYGNHDSAMQNFKDSLRRGKEVADVDYITFAAYGPKPPPKKAK